MGKFVDWVVVVTGGASGLGKATATKLVQEGAKVCILDCDAENGAKVATELGPQNAHFVKTDVTSDTDVENAIKVCKEQFGRVSGLVNFAGITRFEKTYDMKLQSPHSLASFKKIIEVNLIGTFNTCRLAAAAMKDNLPNKDGQRGVIINTSSILGYEGSSSLLAYSTSKAGVMGMTLPMARDLAELGIRVMTLAPGGCTTPMMAGIPETAKTKFVESLIFPKRFVEPEDVARLVLTILDNPMLNGETIRIDGATRTLPDYGV